ncbi:OmpA family protein [Novosphingobium sp. ZN18A2]|uniref:OmpA family protein n=1 Tax=Novosphingobium sp. ZN18A2 TaxID=3079861 RepID=UPI0030D31C86
MSVLSKKPKFLLSVAMLALPMSAGVAAQAQTGELPAAQAQAQAAESQSADPMATIYGQIPADLSGMPDGPEIDGIISARSGHKMQITSQDGTNTVLGISDATEIKSSGGFLGLNHDKLAADSLLNGLPVSVKTVQWSGGLLASKVELKSKDLKTATMIRNGTSQQFAQQGAAINKNAAATEALRGRMGDIDKYNIKGTTDVYFDTGKWNLSPKAQSDLCAAASQADGMDNALLLVVGYTDSVGSEDYNQVLSERRAGRVVNYLQQKCGWKPWRMLTPTGMAESDPTADNSTAAGRAQNRRVAVNILVSKSVDGM